MKLRCFAVCLLMIGVSGLFAEDDGNKFKSKLIGFQETPSILSNGTGTFSASLDPGGTSISYTETFSGLSSPVNVSHIHFAEPGVAGAVFVFLCGGNVKPACPAGGGTVTGTITAADVLAVTAQGITGGDLSELLRILKSGNAYVNVHTTNHPGGEIRGQVKLDD
jgi:hypothetical protein